MCTLTNTQLTIATRTNWSKTMLDSKSNVPALLAYCGRLFLLGLIQLLIVIVSPPLLICLVIWRMTAKYLMKFEHKDATIVEGISNFVAYSENPLKTACVADMLCSGEIDVDTIKKAYLEKFSVIPHLQHYIIVKYGYAFWMKEDNFNIDEHVFLCSDFKVTNEKERLEAVEKVHKMPFIPGKSPWRLAIIPHESKFDANNGTPKYTLALMFNHVIGDGQSLQYAFFKAMADEPVEIAKSTKVPAPLLVRLLTTLKSIPYFPYIAYLILSQRSNMFRDKTMKKAMITIASPNFSVAKIKQIRTAAKAPFISVIHSLVVGAFRKYVLRHNLPLPSTVCLSSPFIVRNFEPEQGALNNNFFPYSMLFPVSDGSAKDRLINIAKCKDSALNVAMLEFNKFAFLNVIALLPSMIMLYFSDTLATTIYMSPGGSTGDNIGIFGNGNKFIDFVPRISLNSKQGIAVTAFSHARHVLVSLNIAPELLNEDEDPWQFLKDMEEELQELEKDFQ